LLIAPHAALVSQQAPQVPRFRAELDIARVSVRALDAKRRPIEGLSASDFTVLLDGQPRRILAVATEEHRASPPPARGAWIRTIAPDVAQNVHARPRLVVIIIDDALIPPEPFVLKTAKTIARTAVDQLAPTDLAAIVFTRDNREPRDFTADRARLFETIERTTYGFDPREPPEWIYGMQMSMKTMRTAVQMLSAMPSVPSFVIWVTVGFEIGLSGPTQGGRYAENLNEGEAELAFRTAVNATVDAAHASGVPVFAVSPLGLVAPIVGQDGRTSIGGWLSARYAKNAAESLRMLADSTGGRAVVLNNMPADLVPAVFEETALHYTIAYEAPGAMADGRYRRLEVRVNRPGVVVEPGGERMFYSPKPPPLSTAPHTTRAMAGLIPLADEPLRLAMAAVADQSPRSNEGRIGASVALALAVDAPADSSALGDTISVELRVFDAEGRRQIHERNDTYPIPRTGSGRDRYFDFLSTVALAPGRYNVRVSARSEARNKTGSVHTDITIPDYGRAPLSVSDVIVSAPRSRTAVPLQAIEGVLPVVPSTARAFANTDRAAAFLRVYWGRQSRAGAVTIETSIRDTDDRLVVSESSALRPGSSEATDQLRWADFRFDVPLVTLTPGEYLLTLRIMPASGGDTVRHVRFRVE
jgi:VWFA-related protein